MGCAIVAHPIACEGIDVTDGQDILLGSTADELVAHCLRLFDDEPLRRRLSAAAIKLAESTYTFKSIGAKLAALCSSIALAADRTPG